MTVTCVVVKVEGGREGGTLDDSDECCAEGVEIGGREGGWEGLLIGGRLVCENG